MGATIRKAGCIPFLLSVFETTTFVPAIENALGTLLSLAETQENRFAIAQAGAINLLIRLMESEHPSVVEKVAGAVWNLSHEETVQHTVRQLGGLKPLSLLSRDSPLIRFNAVGAMPLLTELEENIVEAFELGAVPPLVNLLETETNVLVLQNAAQTLGNIAEKCSEYQQAICEHNGLKRLVQVIEKWASTLEADAGQLDPSDMANRQELLAKCCFAAWLICQKNEVNQIAFCETGGVSGIVKLLNPQNDSTLLEQAAGAICALCEGCERNKDRFREEEGLAPLIHLLGHSCDHVKLNSAKALCHLAENETNRKIIRDLNGIAPLLELLAR